MDTKNKNLQDMLEEKLEISTARFVADLLNNMSVKELYDLIESHELEYHCKGANVPKNHPYSLFTYHQETTSELIKKVKDLEEENTKLKADMQKIKDLHEGIRLITDFIIDMNMKGL